MAARHLQRLREASTPAPVAAVADSVTDDEGSPAAAPAPFNPFDLLSDEEVRGAPWSLRRSAMESPATQPGDCSAGSRRPDPPACPASTGAWQHRRTRRAPVRSPRGRQDGQAQPASEKPEEEEDEGGAAAPPRPPAQAPAGRARRRKKRAGKAAGAEPGAPPAPAAGAEEDLDQLLAELKLQEQARARPPGRHWRPDGARKARRTLRRLRRLHDFACTASPVFFAASSGSSKASMAALWRRAGRGSAAGDGRAGAAAGAAAAGAGRAAAARGRGAGAHLRPARRGRRGPRRRPGRAPPRANRLPSDPARAARRGAPPHARRASVAPAPGTRPASLRSPTSHGADSGARLPPPAGGGPAGGNRRVRRLVARGVLRRVPLRRGLLVTPRDTWPPPDGGLALEPAGHAADGAPLFRYAHSAGYLARAPAAPLPRCTAGCGAAYREPCACGTSGPPARPGRAGRAPAGAAGRTRGTFLVRRGRRPA